MAKCILTVELENGFKKDILVEGDIRAIHFKKIDEDVVAKNKKPKYTDIDDVENLFK